MPFLALGGAILGAGDKPVVPDWKDVPLDDAARQAQGTNKSLLPDYMETASAVNSFTAKEIERMLTFANPRFHEVENKFLDNLDSGLRGELPSDVQQLIERKTAESAVRGGFSGSGVHRNLTARDLGLTSLQLTQTAMSSADQWLARARDQARAPLMDVTRMFITPEQQFQANWMNAENRYNNQWLKNKIEAMPDPTDAAIGQWMQQTDNAIFGTALSMAGGMMGGGMGGGGGGGKQIYSQSANSVPAAQFSDYAAPQASQDWKFKLY